MELMDTAVLPGVGRGFLFPREKFPEVLRGTGEFAVVVVWLLIHCVLESGHKPCSVLSF